MPRQTKNTVDVNAMNNLTLTLSFLCVNGVAFAIRPEMAAMMMVPNIFVLFQHGIVGHAVAAFVFMAATAVMAVYSTDTFCILVVHSLFYLSILLKNVADRTKIPTPPSSP